MVWCGYSYTMPHTDPPLFFIQNYSKMVTQKWNCRGRKEMWGKKKFKHVLKFLFKYKNTCGSKIIILLSQLKWYGLQRSAQSHTVISSFLEISRTFFSPPIGAEMTKQFSNFLAKYSVWSCNSYKRLIDYPLANYQRINFKSKHS
jgi:hypothetical protein